MPVRAGSIVANDQLGGTKGRISTGLISWERRFSRLTNGGSNFRRDSEKIQARERVVLELVLEQRGPNIQGSLPILVKLVQQSQGLMSPMLLQNHLQILSIMDSASSSPEPPRPPVRHRREAGHRRAASFTLPRKATARVRKLTANSAHHSDDEDQALSGHGLHSQVPMDLIERFMSNMQSQAGHLVHNVQRKAANASEMVHHAEEMAIDIYHRLKDWKACHFEKLPNWLKDNEHLHFGHRPEIPCFAECFKSIFRIHTETGNIWTHLVGFILFVVATIVFYVKPLCDTVAVVPVVHHIILNGVQTAILEASVHCTIIMGALYLTGAVLYAARIPERFYPGKCDIWFQSHQIFHILVIVAAFVHYHGISEMAIYRLTRQGQCELDDLEEESLPIF
eukprot:snap_masked-scaffold265_size231475-processed-gene-0.7 protein:Tk00110 transcript:snap_masked-scaffold265_size231475-processed-gene-0.7-mRNA-1 annotation:"adiponectin receptor protein 2-like"